MRDTKEWDMMQLHVSSALAPYFYKLPVILPGYTPELTSVVKMLLLADCFWCGLRCSAGHVPRAGA